MANLLVGLSVRLLRRDQRLRFLAVEYAQDVGAGELGGAQCGLATLAGHVRSDDHVVQVEQRVVAGVGSTSSTSRPAPAIFPSVSAR